MLAIERRNQIMEKLQEEKKVYVSSLSQFYQVSEETIRRDLEKLEKEGLVTKSYGGAVLKENNNIDLPFNVRKNRNVEAKIKIAKLLAMHICDGDSLMLDSSSTAVFVAKHIKDKKNITIITNSIEILIELSDVSDWHILSTGGALKESSLDLIGPNCSKTIQSYHVNKAIVSCKGIDIRKGLTDANEMQAEVKKAMFESAEKRILAIDSSKFDCISFTNVGEMSELSYIFTDKKPEDKYIQYFDNMGIECIYPD
ncbi:MAG: Transcriptional regulator of sugar metabolism [Herbinix sp.]|jgi:DeoR/GlpR family transcriptional regulator of sugar metabolism|nr:Transcriptional regulator of sugar metabolism [Herbinix sp.]